MHHPSGHSQDEKHHEHRLKFFASPFVKDEKHLSSTTIHVSEDGLDDDDDPEKGRRSSTLFDISLDDSESKEKPCPSFLRRSEATTSELFYDLFFVANLTTFTANLYINDSDCEFRMIE